MSTEVFASMDTGRTIHLNGFVLKDKEVFVFYDMDKPRLFGGEEPVIPGTPEYGSVEEIANHYLACYTDSWFKGGTLVDIKEGKLVIALV